MMSNPGRLVLVITLLLVAIVLHLTLCQWSLVWPHGDPLITLETQTDRMGLYTTAEVSKADGLVFGVATPILLVGIGSMVLLNWFAMRRQLRTGCQTCGYDLRSHASGPCPECGIKAPALV